MKLKAPRMNRYLVVIVVFFCVKVAGVALVAALIAILQIYG